MFIQRSQQRPNQHSLIAHTGNTNRYSGYGGPYTEKRYVGPGLQDSPVYHGNDGVGRGRQFKPGIEFLLEKSKERTITHSLLG